LGSKESVHTIVVSVAANRGEVLRSNANSKVIFIGYQFEITMNISRMSAAVGGLDICIFSFYNMRVFQYYPINIVVIPVHGIPGSTPVHALSKRPDTL
jgi:hypothetical protein